MGGSPAAFVFRGCSSFPDRIAWWESIHTGGAIRCTDSSRENALRQPCRLRWEKINVKRYGGSPTALLFVDVAAFRIELHGGDYLPCICTGRAIWCTNSSRENALWQSCRLRWEKINIKRYGWKRCRFAFRGCSSFPDRFARLELSALAERFDAQIRVEKTPCGSRAVCVGKK